MPADASIPGFEDLADTRELLPLPELTASAHAAWRAYVDGRYTELLASISLRYLAW